jgi:hypothetical protein
MPAPSLTRLLQPYGQFSPASVLWNQVGAAPIYEILLGCAELLGGLLLLLPRTATLGAMLSLVSLAQVFVLNMTYDVPVKLLALHLMLLSIVVLAPEVPRLIRMLVLDRVTGPSTQPQPFRSPWGKRVAVLTQLALGIWVLIGVTHMNWTIWTHGGGGTPKPPLYGIWAVTEFTQNGAALPPLTTDNNRWQRLIFDVTGVAYQRMDGAVIPAVATIDNDTFTLAVADPTRPPGPPVSLATFTFRQPTPDRLQLDGNANGRPAAIDLERVDLEKFPLRSRGFHLIQEYPYFR